jgi:hypothetical protein
MKDLKKDAVAMILFLLALGAGDYCTEARFCWVLLSIFLIATIFIFSAEIVRLKVGDIRAMARAGYRTHRADWMTWTIHFGAVFVLFWQEQPLLGAGYLIYLLCTYLLYKERDKIRNPLLGG